MEVLHIMTIHTFETKAMVSRNDFYKIQEHLKASAPSEWKAEKTGMDYWGLSKKGILINLYRVDKKEYHSFYIIYRISARRVIENDNFIGLFCTEKYDELESIVDNLLKEKSPLLPKLHQTNLSRLDFCVNAKLENQKQVKAYIKTIKKANVPSKMEVYQRDDKKSKRKKPPKDEFTVYCSDYVTVSIYNKYREMKNEAPNVFPTKDVEKAKNILRIEIRCKVDKIRVLKKKYKIKTISEFMKSAQKIGSELYRYYLTKICNTGYICTLKEAVERIKMSEYKKSDINLLQEFIRDCNTSRSVAKTMKQYKDWYGKAKTKKIVELLNNIETSFLTVPPSDIKLFDNGYIPTPMELYEEFME